jgi:hypothetical protein
VACAVSVVLPQVQGVAEALPRALGVCSSPVGVACAVALAAEGEPLERDEAEGATEAVAGAEARGVGEGHPVGVPVAVGVKVALEEGVTAAEKREEAVPGGAAVALAGREGLARALAEARGEADCEEAGEAVPPPPPEAAVAVLACDCEAAAVAVAAELRLAGQEETVAPSGEALGDWLLPRENDACCPLREPAAEGLPPPTAPAAALPVAPPGSSREAEGVAVSAVLREGPGESLGAPPLGLRAEEGVGVPPPHGVAEGRAGDAQATAEAVALQAPVSEALKAAVAVALPQAPVPVALSVAAKGSVGVGGWEGVGRGEGVAVGSAALAVPPLPPDAL